MNNKESFQKLSDAMAAVINGTISLKEAKAIRKEAAKINKQLVKELNEFKRCTKIAINRKDPLKFLDVGFKRLYGIPTTNKHFYFDDNIDSKETFDVDGIEYTVIYQEAIF